jgi:quercetin dioxygenase-like cupin family protein
LDLLDGHWRRYQGRMANLKLSPAIEALPWMPVAPGFDLKLVRGGDDDDTCVEVLRLQPGTVIPRHRHTGEVHAWHLTGQRKLLDTGEILGAGSYLYEPPGNVDSWMAVGDTPLVVFVTLRGAVEYLDDAGVVTHRASIAATTAKYRDLVSRA